MSDAIVTRELTKRYRKHLALDSLNLTVPEGSVYALLGANGAGKTTALKLLMNLHPQTGGEATVLGVDSRQLQGHHFEQIGRTAGASPSAKEASITPSSPGLRSSRPE